MVVIVVLTLSASAIAMPPLSPSPLFLRLQKEGVGATQLKQSECCYRPMVTKTKLDDV